MKKEILEKLEIFKQKAEELNLTVYAVALKGSQNYNLHDEESDIDANLVFIPSLKQMRTNEKFKIETEFGECTCHNIYSFAEIVAKGNPQWVEVCNTEYVIGDLSIFSHFKLNPSALKGMIMEKFHAFDKLYPSRKKYIEEFGYDPKQLHHIIRLYDCLKLGVNFHKYNEKDREYMMDIKRGRKPGNKQDAEEIRDGHIHLLNEIYEEKKLAYVKQEVDYDMIDEIVIKFLCKC
jgi:predicted nucleotidyltransferase